MGGIPLRTFFWGFVFLFVSFSFSQTPSDLYKASLERYAAHDNAGYLGLAEKAKNADPERPDFIYNLARAYAVNGNKVQCIERLEDLSVFGFDYDVMHDSGFANVWNHSLLPGILEKAKEKAHHPASALLFEIHENDLIPEGITYNPRTGDFFLSSVYKRKIITVHPDGSTEDFIPEQSDGLLSIYGMKVDAPRNQLWAAGSMLPPVSVKYPAEEGHSELYKIDIDSKSIVGRYSPGETNQHMFNDLTILGNGDVFVTDMRENALYKLDQQAGTFIKWFQSPDMIAPNGITHSFDQRYLFVACQAGILRIALDDRTSLRLSSPPKTPLNGIDGLYFYNNDLIAIQPFAGPQARVMKFELNKTMDAVRRGIILESDNPLYDTPTTGTIVGNELYINGASHLVGNHFGKDGTLTDPASLKPTCILQLQLDQ